jgi:Ca2+-transporting ATPase
MLRSIAFYGGMIAAVTIVAFALGGTTSAFMTLALAQILHLGNARSVGPVLAPRFAFANRAALAAVALAMGLQLVAAFFEPLARVLGVTPLSAREWALVGALGALPAVLGQGLKLLRAGRERRRQPGEAPAGSGEHGSATKRTIHVDR